MDEARQQLDSFNQSIQVLEQIQSDFAVSKGLTYEKLSHYFLQLEPKMALSEQQLIQLQQFIHLHQSSEDAQIVEQLTESQARWQRTKLLFDLDVIEVQLEMERRSSEKRSAPQSFNIEQTIDACKLKQLHEQAQSLHFQDAIERASKLITQLQILEK